MLLDNIFRHFKYRVINLLRSFEVDRPVVFGLLAKIWALSTGLITALLIATKLSPEIQGYYFTFATILTLQAFVELGLGAVIVQFAGHEWGKLSLNETGEIVGDSEALSRLRSIAKIAIKWYFVGSIVIALGLSIGGHIFFSNAKHILNINWIFPWLSLCLVTGVSICLVPIWSLLEGCNQVAPLYAFRFYQGVVSSITVWISISVGAELWTGTISGLSILVMSLYFLLRKYYGFLKSIVFGAHNHLISWKKDILPMQWRMSVASISWFFVYSFFVPIIFKYYGPVMSGQMGLTVGIIMAIGNLSFSWFTPKIPYFCMLIAEKNYVDLDTLFFHNTKITFKILLAMSVLFFIAIHALDQTGLSVAKRLLPPSTATIFLAAYFVGFASAPFSHYMRAHKKEPIVLVTFFGAVFTGIATYITGKYYTIDYMAVSYLIVNTIMTCCIIVIWHFNRLKWQGKNKSWH